MDIESSIKRLEELIDVFLVEERGNRLTQWNSLAFKNIFSQEINKLRLLIAEKEKSLLSQEEKRIMEQEKSNAI